jgi:hypothetical protein
MAEKVTLATLASQLAKMDSKLDKLEPNNRLNRALRAASSERNPWAPAHAFRVHYPCEIRAAESREPETTRRNTHATIRARRDAPFLHSSYRDDLGPFGGRFFFPTPSSGLTVR